MPAYPAFLPRLLRLQICDRNFRCGGTFTARAFRRARKRGCVSEFFALGRLPVSAGDLEAGRCGYGHACTDRKRIAFVRTPAHRTRRALAVGRPCQTPWRFTETPYNYYHESRHWASYHSVHATAKQPTAAAIETAVPREFREAWRVRGCGIGLAKWKADRRSLRRISRCASRKSVDERHTCLGLVGDERNRQRMCLARIAGA